MEEQALRVYHRRTLAADALIASCFPEVSIRARGTAILIGPKLLVSNRNRLPCR
nr:hypothetical protein [Bradyrhizobium jicamae]